MGGRWDGRRDYEIIEGESSAIMIRSMQMMYCVNSAAK